MRPLRILLLGGTSEAAALARLLADERRFAPTLSLAGRTRAPAPPPIPYRVGGFGGVNGLVAYLVQSAVGAVIDATHPFATRISANAVAATTRAGRPLLRLTRPEWRPEPGDLWTQVADMTEAASALGETPRVVLLTVGRQELAPFRHAPQHRYVIRSVDAPDIGDVPPCATVITARGPFTEADETALLRSHAIDVVVSKNSGAAATYAKVLAARRLGIRVVMVRRPAPPHCLQTTTVETVTDPAGALAWLARHHLAGADRGV